MKKLIIVILISALAFNIAAGRRGKKKAGEMIDNVYCDNQYGFSMEFSNDFWDYSIKRDDDAVRVILTKQQYDIPTHFIHAPNYTQVPKVTVYVDTTSMTLQMFTDSLLSDEYKSKQKNQIIGEFNLLFGDFVPQRRSKMKVDEEDAIMVIGERQYTMNVQKAGTESNTADVVTDFYGGALLLVKKGDMLLMLHFICEKRYLAAELEDFMKLGEGMRFETPDEAAERIESQKKESDQPVEADQ